MKKCRPENPGGIFFWRSTERNDHTEATCNHGWRKEMPG
jgi:hypothetical protein